MRVEEMVAVGAAAQQAMRALLTVARMRAWVAPDVRVVPHTIAPVLAPGDRFRLEVLAGVRFEYMVEAVSDREVVLGFDGPWRGRERWSFVPDGAETVVRRAYDVEDSSPLAALAWRAAGWAVVSGHYKLELSRFKAEVERDPGPRGEIEASDASSGTTAPGAGDSPAPQAPPPPPPPSDYPPFPVDDG